MQSAARKTIANTAERAAHALLGKFRDYPLGHMQQQPRRDNHEEWLQQQERQQKQLWQTYGAVR